MRDHLPPLLRGLGFALVLVTSLVVATTEQRERAHSRERLAHLRAQVESDTVRNGGVASREIATELRRLRLQLQNADEDLADRIFENLWFQLLGTLGTAVVAASFFYEAALKWPRSGRRGRDRRPDE